MYATDVPPAPPGLIWWEYLNGVPPLPDPATYFGLSNWTNWGWQYDPDYTVPFYSYTDLDQARGGAPGWTPGFVVAWTKCALLLIGITCQNSEHVSEHAVCF